MNERVRRLIAYAERCGFSLDKKTSSNHYRLTHPNGALMFIASTPGNRRGDLNSKAQMRRLSGTRPERSRS